MKKWTLLMIAAMFLLSACGGGKKGTPTSDPNAVYTSLAETVVVQLTHNAALSPSATNTQEVSNTPLPPSPQPATAAPVATNTSAPAATNTLPVTNDRVEYLGQTPGDGAAFAPNETFTVTWQIKNVGQTTWTNAYSLRFFSGSRIGAGLSNSYTFTKSVAPGETYSITAEFKTGSDLGEFQSNWVLTNQDGNNFYPLYITIQVKQPTATPTVTETTEPTPSATETLTSTP